MQSPHSPTPFAADAAASLAKLADLGFQFEVLSGDDQRVVDSVVRELGVPLSQRHAAARAPRRSLRPSPRLRADGQRVFMVGDGVNDAAAMAAANVGIAVHGGAEACLSAADVFTTRPGLETVALAATGSKRTMRVIRSRHRPLARLQRVRYRLGGDWAAGSAVGRDLDANQLDYRRDRSAPSAYLSLAA